VARVVFTSTREREDYGERMGETAFVPKDDLSVSAVLEALGAA
jgi:hypothetical protein